MPYMVPSMELMRNARVLFYGSIFIQAFPHVRMTKRLYANACIDTYNLIAGMMGSKREYYAFIALKVQLLETSISIEVHHKL